VACDQLDSAVIAAFKFSSNGTHHRLLEDADDPVVAVSALN